jgi:hypothetical protein
VAVQLICDRGPLRSRGGHVATRLPLLAGPPRVAALSPPESGAADLRDLAEPMHDDRSIGPDRSVKQRVLPLAVPVAQVARVGPSRQCAVAVGSLKWLLMTAPIAFVIFCAEAFGETVVVFEEPPLPTPPQPRRKTPPHPGGIVNRRAPNHPPAERSRAVLSGRYFAQSCEIRLSHAARATSLLPVPLRAPGLRRGLSF